MQGNVYTIGGLQTTSKIDEEVIFCEWNNLRHLLNQLKTRFSIHLTQSIQRREHINEVISMKLLYANSMY